MGSGPVQRSHEKSQSLLDASEQSQLSHRSADEISCQTLKRCDCPCSDTSHGTPTSEARTPLPHQSQVAWKANTLERNPLQAFAAYPALPAVQRPLQSPGFLFHVRS